jgi:DNA-binding response OmpR family regulator
MDKVMLIEDDETMLSLIQTLLEIEGFEVAQPEQVATIQAILEEVRKKRPALVLLDVHLRHLNGLDLLRSIRQDHELNQTRVLMSSGMEVSQQCLREGADGFILKPYMPDELIAKIRSTLGS